VTQNTSLSREIFLWAEPCHTRPIYQIWRASIASSIPDILKVFKIYRQTDRYRTAERYRADTVPNIKILPATHASAMAWQVIMYAVSKIQFNVSVVANTVQSCPYIVDKTVNFEGRTASLHGCCLPVIFHSLISFNIQVRLPSVVGFGEASS